MKLGDMGIFLKGSGVRKDEAQSGDLPCIRYGEIYTHHNDCVRCYNSWISKTVAATAVRLKKGDLLFAGSGETKEEIGKCVAFIDDCEAYAGGDIVIFRIREADPVFMGYYCNTAPIKNQMASKGQGDAIVHISASALASVEVMLPTLPEQRAIATALSDVDTLLEGLDRLIAKKRDLKQAAMQQLLTGKTRLPGFREKWKTKQLSEIGRFKAGSGFPNRYQGISSGDHPFFKVSDMNNKGNDIFMKSANNYIDESIRRQIGAVIFPSQSIIFAKVGAAVFLERKRISDCNCCIDNNMSGFIIDTTRVDSRFVHYMLLRKRLGDLVATTALPSLNSRVLNAIECDLPPLSEQIAIAAVLSNMDAEIEALEQRRAKTAGLKLSMMQELLTGRTRLIEPKVVEAQAASAQQSTKGHNKAFHEAVVIAVLANHFGNENYPIGRFRYTKLSYLLHRHAEGKAEGYLKKAAGPYNPKTRYGGSEKIALQNGYILEHQGSKGNHGFIASDKVAEAESYFTEWYGPETIRWLEQFRFHKNEYLELLATVDMAAVELRAVGKAVNVATVKVVIGGDPEWKAKLGSPAFSDANIAKAIKRSDDLFGTTVSGGDHV